MRQSPAAGKTSRARNEPRLPVARTLTRPGPEAVTRTVPEYDRGRTASRTVHARPATGAARLPVSDTRTGPAAEAEHANTVNRRSAPATRFMPTQTHEVERGLQNGVMPSRASIGVAAVAVAAGLWGMDALIRRPLAQATEPATIVLGEHVVLVAVLLPVVVVALPAVWRAGPRYLAAAIVIGAGSSALATILFTQAFVDGDPVTPVVLQKVQPLIAVSLAAVMLGERPRPRFGLFLAGGVIGTWLMAFPSPFDVSLHGQAPVFYALAAAALWALGTVLGRFLALEMPFQQVTALRFAFGLPAALAAVLVLGAPLSASLHDELFIALLALVTGLVALLLYYYGLQRTTASVASVAELAFPVVAIAVGYFAFDATLTGTQVVGVAVTSLVVLVLPRRGPALVAAPEARPAYAGS
jgi:drug/metabolite transporter (DMT)-like permease